MSDSKLLPGIDLAGSLSKLTGSSYENCLHELNHVDRPTVVDNCGNFNLKAYRDLARGHMVSDSAIVKEVSNITGSSYESVLIKINMPKLGKL